MNLFSKIRFMTTTLAPVAMLCLSSPSFAACTSPAGLAGDMNYDTGSNTYEYCNNTSWIDMEDPSVTSPAFVHGQLSGHFAEGHIAIDGDYAYGLRGTRIYRANIANPASMTLQSSLNSASRIDTSSYADVKIQGDYAYAASSGANNGFSVFRVKTAGVISSMTNAGFLAQTLGNIEYPSDVAISGNYAFVASRYYNGASSTGQLTAINISTPSNPTLSGTLNSSNLANSGGISISGNYAYVASQTGNRLSIVNISNPASLSLTGSLNATNLGGAADVAISGSYAFVAAPSVDRLTVVNISTPASPTEAASLTTSNLDGARRVIISGNYAYVLANGASSCLSIIDITTPTSPSEVGALCNSAFAGSGDLVLSGSNIFIATGTRISTVNVSTPSSPTLSNMFNNATLGNIYDVKLSGTTLFVSDYANHRIHAVSIATPTSPSIVGTYTDKQRLNTPTSLAISGSNAYVVGSGNRITAVNISTPSSPTLTGSYFGGTILAYTQHLELNGNYAYVGDLGNLGGLAIVNISNPASPTLTSTLYTVGNSLSGMARSGNYIYMSFYSPGEMVVIDVSTPTAPTIVSRLTGLTYPQSIHIEGNYAFITGSQMVIANGHFYVIDISNPASPSVVGSLTNNASLVGAERVIVDGNYAFVGKSSGIALVNIATKTAPSIHSVFTYTDVGDIAGMGYDPAKKIVYFNDWSGAPWSLSAIDVSLSFGVCTQAGSMEYHTQNLWVFCNGTVKKPMGPIGAGGSGCTSPTGARSDMIYESNVYKYCDGANWVTIN